MVQFLTVERGWDCCVLVVVSCWIVLDRRGAVTTRVALAARQNRDKIATTPRGRPRGPAVIHPQLNRRSRLAQKSFNSAPAPGGRPGPCGRIAGPRGSS